MELSKTVGESTLARKRVGESEEKSGPEFLICPPIKGLWGSKKSVKEKGDD